MTVHDGQIATVIHFWLLWIRKEGVNSELRDMILLSDFSTQINPVTGQELDNKYFTLNTYVPFQEDLEFGITTWENGEYFKQWEDKLINKLKSGDDSPEWDCDLEQESFSPKDEADEQDLLEDVKRDIKDESIKISFLKLKESPTKVKKENSYNNNKKYYCNICPDSSQSWNTRKKYSKHMFEEHQETFCKICFKNFTVFKEFSEHKHKRIIRNKEFHCDMCPHFWSSTEKKYSKHMFEMHQQTSCDICSKVFTDFDKFREHERYHTGNKYKYNKKYKENNNPEYNCESCNFTTIQKKRYDKHMFELHEQTLCSDCGLNFTSFHHLYQHSLTHLDPHKCDTCGKGFFTKKELARHIKKYHSLKANDNNNKQVCPHCGIFYRDLTNHIRIKHDNNYVQYKCQHCNYETHNEAHLQLHRRRRHEMSNPVNCPWCNRFVKELDKHLIRNQCNVPLEERKKKEKLKCQLCSKEFQWKHGLIRHMKNIHEQKKDFQCELCDYKTYLKSNLYLHVKRMHEGRPLKESCPHCDKIVVNIEYHIKTYHTNVDAEMVPVVM